MRALRRCWQRCAAIGFDFPEIRPMRRATDTLSKGYPKRFDFHGSRGWVE
jgi:hypothetical protein